MKVVIKVLDVKDGDAAIVKLTKGKQELIFLIDAGKPAQEEMVFNELKAMLDESNKACPDFILCTHYDNDHIGGILGIIKRFQQHKPQVWMFKTSEQVNILDFKKKLRDYAEEDSIFPSESDAYLTGGAEQEERYYVEAIRTVEQEMDVISFLKTINADCLEPIAENFKIEGWPELKIVSPSTELYQKLFPKKFTAEDLIRSEVEFLKNEQEDDTPLNVEIDPFDLLDKTKRSSITAPNMGSAMLMITAGNNRLLFAADAGIQAFDSIPAQELEGLYWLKVPHHGSKNNITSDLIKLMNPKKTVISGDKLIAPLVKRCFEKLGAEVYTTKENGHIILDEEFDS